MIPKLLHRAWFGPKEMPEEFVHYREMWAEQNPDWTVIDWDLDIIDDFVCKPTIDLIMSRANGFTVELATQIADIAGYELTYKHGGIYMNADIKPVKPLSELFRYFPQCETSAFSAGEYGGFAVNAVTGGPAQHPFWRAMLEALPARYESYPPGSEMTWTTGPRLLTDTWRARPDLGLVVLPEHVWNPISWQDIELGTSPDGLVDESTFPPDTIGMHVWHHRKTQRSNIVP